MFKFVKIMRMAVKAVLHMGENNFLSPEEVMSAPPAGRAVILLASQQEIEDFSDSWAEFIHSQLGAGYRASAVQGFLEGSIENYVSSAAILPKFRIQFKDLD